MNRTIAIIISIVSVVIAAISGRGIVSLGFLLSFLNPGWQSFPVESRAVKRAPEGHGAQTLFPANEGKGREEANSLDLIFFCSIAFIRFLSFAVFFSRSVLSRSVRSSVDGSIDEIA